MGCCQISCQPRHGLNVFLASDDPTTDCALHRVTGGVWQFEQRAGRKNAAPSAGTKSALIRGLSPAGLKIVETDPQSALARIEQAATRGRKARMIWR